MTQITSKNQTPARPKYGYTGRYTNPPFCCPIDGWMVGDREVDRETALKAFERYADALEKQLSAATTGLGAVIEAERRSGHETKLPQEPSPGLLMSMAIRMDHGFGVPGYYDQPMFTCEGLTHQDRLQAALSTARQMWEEVAGVGFYHPDKEAEYAARNTVKASAQVGVVDDAPYNQPLHGPSIDEIRDLGCCDTFVRESASEFCATCGYTNLDHLRKRARNSNMDGK